jgi:hypothetical protein
LIVSIIDAIYYASTWLDNARLKGSVSLTPDITIDITESRVTGNLYGTLESGYTYRTIDHQKNAGLEDGKQLKLISLLSF